MFQERPIFPKKKQIKEEEVSVKLKFYYMNAENNGVHDARERALSGNEPEGWKVRATGFRIHIALLCPHFREEYLSGNEKQCLFFRFVGEFGGQPTVRKQTVDRPSSSHIRRRVN
ncbi:hypothetical protein ECG_06308 [Echinococcus granulosus]|nr:hypothetical protein ECG_06308 [Echinococcus granulosus]